MMRSVATATGAVTTGASGGAGDADAGRKSVAAIPSADSPSTTAIVARNWPRTIV
jgi:hypothetical protein